jgi:phosphatidylglycerophosphate synthase
MNEAPVVRREVKARQAAWANRVAGRLARAGVRPNAISWLSVVFACVAGFCLVEVAGAATVAGRVSLLVAATACIQLRLLCNLFDGMVAVEGGLRTKSGEVFNDLPDRLSDPVILVCAGYTLTHIPFGVELGWLAGLLAVLTAYVRMLGGATGAGQSFAGPMAKQHRMAVITLGLLGGALAARWDRHESVIAAALLLIVLGCVVTVIRRVRQIVRTLEKT